MNKSKKKNAFKISKKTKRRLIYSGGGLLLLALIVIAVLMLDPNYPDKMTGSSINVKYYGVSALPMPNQAGKIQTLIELKPSVLKTLSTLAGRNEVAREIAENTDFAAGITELYRKSPPISPASGALDIVALAAPAEKDNFKSNLACLKHIGSNLRNQPANLKLILVSELAYQRCSNPKTGLFAFVKHAFFDQEDNSFICRQDDEKLFLIKDNGEVTTDFTGC